MAEKRNPIAFRLLLSAEGDDAKFVRVVFYQTSEQSNGRR